MKIRILIADDDSFVREGMKIILGTFPEFEVLATVQDGGEAVAYCESHEVDVALLDVRMPVMNGVEAARLISERTAAKPLILTTFDDDAYILEAIRCGARGYLLKNNDPERVRDAIRAVHNGQSVLQDVVLERIKSTLDGGAEPERGAALPFDRSLFTDREFDVAALIAKGLSNREISRKLFLSEGTTANYVTSILAKTGLEHRTQIAIYFLTGKVD